jgi:uncharacterized protein involved in outer membrane biogenesis
MSKNDAKKRPPAAAFLGPPDAWWNWRRKRFWALMLLLVYSLAGFFLVPWVAKRVLVSEVQNYVRLPTSLEELRFNPWTLAIEARGFAIREPDESVIVGFDRLFINIQTSSLFRWALTFREITLDQPFAQVTRYENGELNVQPFIASRRSAPAEPEPETTGPVRLLVAELAVNGGTVEVRDESLPTVFTGTIGPIDVAVQDLTTLPNKSGRQRVSLSTKRGAQLEWSGSLELGPFVSAGHVTGSGPYLPILYQYTQDDLNFELTEGNVELEFDYRIAVNEDTGLEATMSRARSALRGAALIMDDGTGRSAQFATLPEIRMEGGALSWPAQTMDIEKLVLVTPELEIWRAEDGTINVENLLANESAADNDSQTVANEASHEEKNGDATEQAPSWAIRLGEFRIENLAAKFKDQSLAEAGEIAISELNASLREFTTEPGAEFPLEINFALGSGGQIGMDGTLTVLPAISMNTVLTIDQLALGAAQPWLAEQARVRIAGGHLDADTTIQVDHDQNLSVKGSLEVPGLDVTDTLNNERLAGWDNLEIDQFSVSTAENAAELSRIVFQAPYVRLRIDEDQTTNFQDLPIAPDDAATAPPESSEGTESDATPAPDLTVGEIVVRNGSADFSDLSLPLPFAARIAKMEGQASTLSTVSAEPADIKLEGQVDEYGLAQLDGRINAHDPTALTDIHLLFRNVGMPDLSPYTIKFAGQEIDAGKIELDLQYLIKDQALQGNNIVVIKELRLGDKVDHPEATDLPLGLAVALLKGPNGEISLDMPVSGNLDDPKFSIGGVIFGAFVNLITKAATAPFNLLGRLVGADSETFDRIEFKPGQADLTPPEREKLVKLAEALDLRPELELELQGVTDPEADTAALKTARVETAIELRLTEQGSADGDEMLLTERRRKTIEQLTKERLESVDLKAVRNENQHAKDPDEPEGRQVLDEPAYAAALTALLTEAEPVSQDDLDALALARAESVRESITTDGQLAANRVTVMTAQTSELNEAGWIPMQLQLSSATGRQAPESSTSN